MPRRSDAVAESLLQVKDLSAGVNLRQSPTTLRPNQARKLINFGLSEPGALLTYPGWKSQTSDSLGSSRPQGGARIYLSGVTPFMLAAYNGSVYKPSDAVAAWPASVLSGLDASNDIFFPYDRDLVAALDGVNIPKKSTDGSTWTQFGIDAPAAAPTLSAIAGGTLLDTEQYEVSYAYQDDELAHYGNESPTQTITIAAPNQTIRCTIPRSTDAQVDTILVFIRNVTAGEGVRRKVGSVANPAVGNATFDINGPDTDWSAGIEAPTDHNVTPAVSFAMVWKNRWWKRDVTVKNRIYFSQLFQPQSQPTNFYVDIPFERGEDVTAFYPLGDTLVVCGYTKKYVIVGQTSLDFEVRPALGSQSGAFGQRSIDTLEDGVVTASAAGVYIFDGANDRLLSYEIGPGWEDMLQKASTSDIDRIPIAYHVATKELRVAVPSLYPTGAPGEWILDLNRTRLQEGKSAWFATDRTIGGYIQWDGKELVTGNRGRVFSWGTTGKLYEERTGTTADGSDMVCQYDGPTLTMGLQVSRFIDGYVEFQPANGQFSVECIVDGKGFGGQVIDIGGSLPLYGSFTYGSGTYGSGDRTSKPFMLPLGAEGRTVKLAARYTGQVSFRIYTYAIGVVPEPLPRGI